MDYLKKISSNFYVLFIAFFLVWMIFIDSNDVVSQMKSNARYNELRSEKQFYLDKIIEVKEEREALQKDNGLLEKFAREKYFMKKPSEDIYVIVEE